MDIAMGGTTGQDISFPPLSMYDADSGEPNHNNVATHVALSGKAVNIPDAYETDKFDFSGAKNFDGDTGYRSKSFLTLPLLNYHHDVIGVLQLINARDQETDEVITFAPAVQPLIEALASQAAIALDSGAAGTVGIIHSGDCLCDRREILSYGRTLPTRAGIDGNAG